MELGDPIRVIEVVPAEEPVPAEMPEAERDPVEPELEPVEVPA